MILYNSGLEKIEFDYAVLKDVYSIFNGKCLVALN